MVIHIGGLDCKENLVKVKVPVNHKAQGREHLAMVLQKFHRKKCLAVAIPAKVNEKQVVAIVDTGSAGVVIFRRLF